MSPEVKKQLIDQSLHLVGGAAAVVLIAWQAKSIELGVALVAAFWIFREMKQGWSSRPWDSPLDLLFEAAGLFLGWWVYRAFIA